PRRAAPAGLDLCPHKHSLLIVIGRTAHPGQTGHISREIERGIRSWKVDLKSCDLNLHLRQFLSYHTASFKGVASSGHKCLRHSTRVLDAQVLICPSQEQVFSEVRALLSQDSAFKLLILAGESVEEGGDLLFHRGLFSPKHLKQILAELFIDPEICSSKVSLTLSCPNVGLWRDTLVGSQPLWDALTLHVNPPEVLSVMEAVGEFASLITGTISPLSPFDLLPPPSTVGFLKLSRPCCYVFPAGRGDCAFFAVSGFTMLMDGGSDSRACFWKLVRHLDRVDAVLLTHAGTENLPGVNAFLERKVAEMELSSDIKDDSSKRLISPELGVVFFNAPNSADGVLKSTQQAALALQLLKKLDITPQPLFRPQSVPVEPITLFQKMGVGQLDLYILSPDQALPLTALTSASVLLVWHPACPQEKVVRMLFPGVTPQAKLLQGLEKLKGLTFLQKPTVTTGDLQRVREVGVKQSSSDKNTSSRPGGKKEEKAGLKEKSTAVRNDQTKKDAPIQKLKGENKTKPKKEVKKVPAKKTRKPQGKEIRALSGKDAEQKPGNPNKPAKVVGFPSSLSGSPPKMEPSVQLDLTPTEFTLLDGALKYSPSSRPSPENQAASSPDEETVGPDSPDSRPNSAGHTPYCLSPDDESHANSREKQLSFLSLGAFKDGSDPSPSVATTTTTTHSMPAEVSSPQSTEVDESLSMSLEQGPTAGSQREEMGRPTAPNTLHFEGTSHEVDLCLVSPCEFKHFKPVESSRGPLAPHYHGNDNHSKDASPSESNAPVCTEDCPSTTADGALDWDEDESDSEPTDSPRDLRNSQTLHQDPPPAPPRDSPPLPPQPDPCMPVPQCDLDNHGKKTKGSGVRGKKSPAPPQITSSGKNRPGNQSGAAKGKASSIRMLSSSSRLAPANSSHDPGIRINNKGSKSTSDEGVAVYVDLAYIPSGVSSSTVSLDFFRRIRSSCYIVSGDSPEREELLVHTLNALLDSKAFWPDGTQVTLIPTYESVQMQEWYQQTVDRQKELGITVLGSNSTVAMQDETFPACKIEF
uniref:Microtubule associated protein 1S n=1 Tax=Tetraodon nigroviridis TaxID=99883 RepID=H3DII1_TETNG